MTEPSKTSVAPVPISRQKRQAKTASRPKRVSGALRVACDLMIHGDDDGTPLEMDQAAKRAGIQTRTLRLSLSRGWVRAYIKQQRELVIQQLAANNLAHIGALRSSSNQMTRLGAARLVEELAGEVEATGSVRRVGPGVTIIIGQPDQRRPAIDVTPQGPISIPAQYPLIPVPIRNDPDANRDD